MRKSAVDQFPQCLDTLPVLLPTGHSTLRSRLDRWLEAQGLAPRIVGEFEDSALMTVFGARGLRWLGRSLDVKEEVHAILSRRGRHHPLTQQVLASAGV